MVLLTYLLTYSLTHLHTYNQHKFCLKQSDSSHSVCTDSIYGNNGYY